MFLQLPDPRKRFVGTSHAGVRIPSVAYGMGLIFELVKLLIICSFPRLCR
jgi:hypothetical protein